MPAAGRAAPAAAAGPTGIPRRHDRAEQRDAERPPQGPGTPRSAGRCRSLRRRHPPPRSPAGILDPAGPVRRPLSVRRSEHAPHRVAATQQLGPRRGRHPDRRSRGPLAGSESGQPRSEQPRVEQCVQLLSRDPLGERDELRGRARCRRAFGAAQRRRIRKNAGSPTCPAARAGSSRRASRPGRRRGAPGPGRRSSSSRTGRGRDRVVETSKISCAVAEPSCSLHSHSA